MIKELLKRILACRNIGYPLPTGIVAEIEAELEKPEPSMLSDFEIRSTADAAGTWTGYKFARAIERKIRGDL